MSLELWLRKTSYWNELSGMFLACGDVGGIYTRVREDSISFSSVQPSAFSNQHKRLREKHMFPEGAFVKMYYFAIEAQDGVGYTLVALRCEVKDL